MAFLSSVDAKKWVLNSLHFTLRLNVNENVSLNTYTVTTATVNILALVCWYVTSE